jgi:hypothetical protein
MYDSRKIIAGLVIFIFLMTVPVWYNAFSKGGGRPVIELPKGDCNRCVLPKGEMKAKHMQILDQWRDEVVREGSRYYKHQCKDNTTMLRQKSLTKGCLASDCHKSKKDFCDKCHNYVGVSNYCWDCHVIPKEPTDG